MLLAGLPRARGQGSPAVEGAQPLPREEPWGGPGRDPGCAGVLLLSVSHTPWGSVRSLIAVLSVEDAQVPALSLEPSVFTAPWLVVGGRLCCQLAGAVAAALASCAYWAWPGRLHVCAGLLWACRGQCSHPLHTPVTAEGLGVCRSRRWFKEVVAVSALETARAFWRRGGDTSGGQGLSGGGQQ